MLYIDDNHRGCVGLKVKYAWYSDGAWILMNEYVICKDWRGKEFFIWYVGNMWLDTKVTLMGAVKRVIFIDPFFYKCTIDKKFIQIVHVVYETLPRRNMKFCVYFANFCVCIGENFSNFW
jgi:hypothetical protein